MASAGDAVRSLPASAAGGLSQTSIIAACMLTGFFVYITCKGQLQAYIAVFTGSGSQQ